MLIKQLIDEDFVNYKKPSMFIGFPTCNWKCEKECGMKVCQNSTLSNAPSIDISINKIIERYVNNPITKAVVIGGLEPFDSWDDLSEFIIQFRMKSKDDIVIYTGYNKIEIYRKIFSILWIPNIIVKFGRFIPNRDKRFDEILGVYLASDNQYAERISIRNEP